MKVDMISVKGPAIPKGIQVGVTDGKATSIIFDLREKEVIEFIKRLNQMIEEK